MDYLDVVAHIFTPQARDYYRLEELWGEAPLRAAGESVAPQGAVAAQGGGAGERA